MTNPLFFKLGLCNEMCIGQNNYVHERAAVAVCRKIQRTYTLYAWWDVYELDESIVLNIIHCPN